VAHGAVGGLSTGLVGDGDAPCPANPVTAATVTLPGPLGDRVLLDGGTHPPSPTLDDLL
jgi:hypothetical protein